MDTRRSAELATISKASISVLLPTVLAAKIEEKAARKRFGRGTMIINRDLTRVPGQDTLTILSVEEPDMASDVTAGNDIPQVDWSVAQKQTIVVTKKGKGTAIQREAVKAGNRDIIAMSLDRLATALARKEDFEVVKNELQAGSQNTDTVTGDGAATTFSGAIGSGNRPVATVDSVTGTVGGEASTNLLLVDYDPEDGSITVEKVADTDTTVTIKSRKIGSQYHTCTTQNDLLLADIRTARGKITKNRWEPDVLICGEEFYAYIVTKLDKVYVDRAKYGAGEELLNFEVGKILGMKVIVTTEIAQRMGILKDSDRASVFVDKEGVLVEHEYNPQKQVREVYASQIYGLGVLQAGAHCAIILKSSS